MSVVDRDATPSTPAPNVTAASRSYVSPADSEVDVMRTPLTGGGTRLVMDASPKTRTGQTSALLERISRLQSRLNERVHLAGFSPFPATPKSPGSAQPSRPASALRDTPRCSPRPAPCAPRPAPRALRPARDGLRSRPARAPRRATRRLALSLTDFCVRFPNTEILPHFCSREPVSEIFSLVSVPERILKGPCFSFKTRFLKLK